MTTQIEEGKDVYASGNWHVIDTRTGKIHKTRANGKSAVKLANDLNNAHYHNYITSDNIHHDDDYVSPYKSVSADHYGNTKNPYNESVEELDEAKAKSLITGTRKIASFGDHAHTAEVRHNKEFNEYEVHHYKNGVHQGEGPMTFHGDDKDLAIQNAKAEVGLHEDYSDKNPKIDLYHHEPGAEDHGKYLGSTKWSPTVKHAVAGYEEKNPEMVGKVKGSKVKGCCESIIAMVDSILAGELNESNDQLKSILAEKIAYRLDETKIRIAKEIVL